MSGSLKTHIPTDTHTQNEDKFDSINVTSFAVAFTFWFIFLYKYDLLGRGTGQNSSSLCFYPVPNVVFLVTQPCLAARLSLRTSTFWSKGGEKKWMTNNSTHMMMNGMQESVCISSSDGPLAMFGYMAI